MGVKSASARKDLELAAEKKLTRDLRARLDATLDKLDDALALFGYSLSEEQAILCRDHRVPCAMQPHPEEPSFERRRVDSTVFYYSFDVQGHTDIQRL